MARQALAGQQHVLGPGHPDVLTSMVNLSNWLGELGQHEAAVAMAQQGLWARLRVLGPEHPYTLTSMANLSTHLTHLGQREAAANMAGQALEARQRVLGREHPDTLTSMVNLSNQLAGLDQHEAAADMARQALAARQRVLGPDHPSTLISMANLSNLSAGLGQPRAVADIALQALTAQQHVLTSGHPAALRSMTNVIVERTYLGLRAREGAATSAQQTLALRMRMRQSQHPMTPDENKLGDQLLSNRIPSLGQSEQAPAEARQTLEVPKSVHRLPASTPNSAGDAPVLPTSEVCSLPRPLVDSRNRICTTAFLLQAESAKAGM